MGINWRQIQLDVVASLRLIGEVSILMVSTGFSVLSLKFAKDPICHEAIAVLIAIHPMTEGDEKGIHIAVINIAKLC
jgi:hypothetical protein